MDGAPSEPICDSTPSPHLGHPAGCACCSGADVCARAERQLRNLAELAEIELAMARLVRAEAEAAAQPQEPETDRPRPAGPNPHAALVLRFGRSVRQTYALEAKLAKEHREWASGVEAARAARRAALREARVERHKMRVDGALERALKAEEISSEQCRELVDELGERLEHEDEFPGLVDQPTAEIVAAICEDHGIALDWDRWAGRPAAALRRTPAEPEPPDVAAGPRPPPAPA